MTGDIRSRIRTPLTTTPLTTRDLELICRRGDSNPHELPHTPLKRARLPVPPLRLSPGRMSKIQYLRGYFLVGAFDGSGLAGGFAAAGDAFAVAGDADGAAD